MKALKLLLRAMRQSRALLLLFSALVVAVTAMTSVAFFVDRVDRGLVLQGAALMAADLVVQQGKDIPESWTTTAQQLGLETSRQISFPSVLFYEDQPLLVQVKGVDEQYPLRGALDVRSINAGRLQQGPGIGEVFIESRLWNKLSATDESVKLPLGELSLDLTGEIITEPDRGGSLFQLAPRVMLNLQDVQASGLLGPASRAKHRLLVAGSVTQVTEFRAWIENRLPVGARILDVNNARPELRTALDRGRRFLSLAALCASLLAGIAILLAARRYVSQVVDTAAILRTLGMTGRQVLLRYLREILMVLLAGTVVGIILGYLGQLVLFALIGGWFGENLPAPGLRPVWIGILYGAVLLPGFSLPVLMRIKQVSPLRVLRRELDPPDASSVLVWGLAASTFTGLVFWQVQDLKLAVSLLMVLVAVMLLSVGCGKLLIKLLSPYRKTGNKLGFGLAALSRHEALTQWQLASFSVGISLLLLLAMVRVDLIDTWQRSLSPTAPNHFLINIQDNEQQALQQWFDQQGIVNSGMYASSRGRLTHIDDKPLNPESFSTERARHLAAREFSLGFSNKLQDDNKVVDGQHWRSGENGFSVEQDLAKKLGIKTGTRLTFDLAGQPLTAEVSNLRTVSWDSFNVNFYVQASEGLMADLPVAYLNSVYLEGNEADVVRKISKDYPAVSILDLRPILKQIRDIMDKGALAVEGVFLFTLLAAALVTWGAVQISREERAREIAVLRTLGASRRQVLLGVLAEFGLLGLLSGLIAATLTSATGYVIAAALFDLRPEFNFYGWFGGMAVGILGLLLVGYFATRRLLNAPPLAVLNTGG